MFTRTFWKDAAERFVRTTAQTAVSVLTIGTTDLLDVDWVGVGSASALAGLISLLMSLGATGQGNNTNASYLNIEPTDPPGKHAAPEN